MHFFSIAHTRIAQMLVVLFLSASLLTPVMPSLVHAQETAQATPAAQTKPANTSSCEGVWGKATNPICWVRGISVALSMSVIYLAGLVLTVAGAFMNGVLALTTVDFNASVYAYVAPGIESVWTVFRDIANIIIIGMFTFIALSMILGIEKFNARQMVAKVLLIAVLINFSLLFTRIIIESSNFFAIQFYKAASFGVDPATGNAAAIGISGKFAQLMGVTSVLETGEALWKAELGSLDPGFMTMALGALVVMVTLVAALLFFYIAFLLVARTLLFIFLLITSSLAFATYLLPGSSIGGYGWSQWWSSLLKNAVFAPLLLMFLWATIQVGTGIKAISGTGSIGGLLADPTKSGNINALFCYLLIIGMLYVSIKVSSSFSHKIGGFNYAALLPAYGAGLLARGAGLFGRQTFGRAGYLGNQALAGRAKDAAEKGNMFAARMYLSGAKQFEGIAKRDFNIMKGQLGKEISGVAGIKKLDSIAGKDLAGFKGEREQYVKGMAELGKKLERSKDEKDSISAKRTTAMAQEIASSVEHQTKSREHSQNEGALDTESRQKTIMEERHRNELNMLQKELEQARNQGGANSAAAQNAQSRIAQARRQHATALDEQNTRIKAAAQAVERTSGELRSIQGALESAAVAAGRVPAAYKEGAEIASDLVKGSYTKALHAAIPNEAGFAKLAKDAASEVGKMKKKEKQKEQVDILKSLAKDVDGGAHKPAAPAGDAKKDDHH